MQDLSPQGRKLVEELSRRHAVDPDAVATLVRAVAAGGGSMAQFSHPALGGMGQWSQGGMIMVGDMFNHALRAKVDALCNEISQALHREILLARPPAASQMQRQGGGSSPGAWWPADLGTPGSVGSQNDTAYAYFPTARRLAVRRHGQVTVYDTQDHRIGGFSQQQGGAGSFGFTSQHGNVALESLPVISGGEMPKAAAAPESGPSSSGDPLATIERLAALKEKGLLSEAEFQAKKAELLQRL